MRRALAICAILAFPAALAGCSSSEVAADEVAEQVSKEITPVLAQKPDDVTCPEDLPAEVDAKTVCTLTLDDEEFDTKVTVTSAKDGRAEFDIECADCTPALTSEEVVKQISTELEAQFGRKPDLTCPGGLASKVGAELTCELTEGGETYDVAVTATSVEGTDVGFTFKVGDVPN